MENNRMDILAASQDLREAALDVFVEFAAFGCTIDERRECSTLLFTIFLLKFTGFL
jgi:hypothetical protein